MLKYNNFILESQTIAGKNTFKCFLKVLTALGLKDTKPNWEKTPDNFIIFFKTQEIDITNVKSIMGRYNHFDAFLNEINYTHNDCQLYYGFKCDMTFEYGISTDDQIIPIGKFKLTTGIINYLLTLSSPSSVNLKRELIHLDINKLSLICKIKTEMMKFVPGMSDKKSNPIINDNIISFGYYGIGKWENGKMDSVDLESIKIKFKAFLSKYKWSEKVQISISSNQFWVYLNIKIK